MKRVVDLKVENQIAIITIQNPPVNVLDEQVIEQLHIAIDQILDQDKVKVVLLTGEGEKAFMAGGDIKSFSSWMGNVELAKGKSLWLQHPINRIEALPQPTICVLNGLALGGGCELSLGCDIRIAEEHVLIGLPEVKLGLFPGAGGTQRLSRLVGLSKAKEIIYTGEPLSALEAKEIGLVNKVVSKGEGLTSGIELANNIAKFSLPALQFAKRAIDEGFEKSLPEGLVIEANYFGYVFQTKDVQEGVAAFVEKRSPNFIDE